MKALFAGLGGIGQRHLRNLYSVKGEQVDVIAWRVLNRQHVITNNLGLEADMPLDRRYNIRTFRELDAALAEKPDITFICNPSSMHVDVAMKALMAGSHVFIEKPLSDSMVNVNALIEVARQRGLVAYVGNQFRFHPLLQALKELLDAKALGRVVGVRAIVAENMEDFHTFEDYRTLYAARRDLGGGVVLSQVHELDYLQWLFGMPRRVTALGGHLSRLELDVEDVASMLLECGSETSPLPISLYMDFVQRPGRRNLEVMGDRGSVVVDLIGGTFVHYEVNGSVEYSKELTGFERNRLFVDQMIHFLACCDGQAEPRVALEEGVKGLRIALAVRESIQQRKTIDLQLPFTGKRVLIAGASRGIGLAMAEGFLREGARVALLARNPEPLSAAVRRLAVEFGEGQVLGWPIDCAEASAWPALLEEIDAAWGGLDVVIANTGEGHGPRVALPDATRFSEAWRANFTSAEVTARAILPMLETSGGCLLFMSSIVGLEVIDSPTDYSVAKSAIVALSKQLARRLAPRVRVNCLAPGNVRVSGGHWDTRMKADPSAVSDLLQAFVPMKRLGTPEEIADAALFLCSERARFITGACLVVDGGQTVRIS